MKERLKNIHKKTWVDMTYICINIIFFVALIVFYEIRKDRMDHLLNGKTIRGYIALTQAIFMGVSYCVYKGFYYICSRIKSRNTE